MTCGQQPPSRFADFRVEVRDEGADVWIDVEGEVDLSVSERLSRAVEDALSRQPTVLHMNLSLVSFVDSSGIAALLSANRAAEAQARPLVIHSPSRAVRRALTLIGLADHFTIEE